MEAFDPEQLPIPIPIPIRYFGNAILKKGRCIKASPKVVVVEAKVCCVVFPKGWRESPLRPLCSAPPPCTVFTTFPPDSDLPPIRHHERPPPNPARTGQIRCS